MVGEYSPSATIISFSKARPLLRVPIETPEHSFLLAFKNPQSWSTSYDSCISQITQQCEAASRIGCSLSASHKCKPPFWKTALGVSKQDFAQRAQCEHQEMEACLLAARESCCHFSKNKCFPAFRDAKVVVDGFVQWREVGKLIGFVCQDRNIIKIEFMEPQKTLLRIKKGLGINICRGEDLMGSQLLIQNLQQS
ncbi:hypothetical protein LIER_20599 [Lithospermum erythrorhizon]|uniref:Uncharacterized protein n=1 Tax=Lithospermum erythrorhizon TaxID=34254 RepID=A0AAV3QPH5_LITER